MEQILEEIVRNRCNSPNNIFGPTSFIHIKSVVENSKLLAEKYGADKQVVMAAAWLHDIASVIDKNYYKDHHIYGAKMAEDILKEINFPNEKINLVKKCILNHRASVLNEKTTKEELCVADADAISHFDNVLSLAYLEYSVRKHSYEEGKEFIKNKLNRSFNKLSEESKKIYIEKYNNVMSLLK